MMPSFFNNGFNGAPWDVQGFGYFFITQPLSVWRAPWSSWCRLLVGALCLVVLHTLGPFGTGLYIPIYTHTLVFLGTGSMVVCFKHAGITYSDRESFENVSEYTC
jgi:hypothetical protein